MARFLVTPAAAGSATTFDASASTVAFGTIASYGWDFGDGTTATTTTPITTHTYQTAGYNTVSVTETSSGGNVHDTGVHRSDGEPQRRPAGDRRRHGGDPCRDRRHDDDHECGWWWHDDAVTLPATGGGGANGTLATMALVLLALGVALIARSRRHPA